MIDKMIRCEKLDANSKIESLCEWFYKCPPQGKLKHWKDGRSAKETAKHWLHTIPQPFKNLLEPKQMKYMLCSPELVSKFDAYGGNGRNHDLLIIAINKDSKKVVISIESKVDEPFGDTVEKTKEAAEKTKQEKPTSMALERIEGLRKDLFGELQEDQLGLMYQLLTAVAGTIAEAKKQGAKSAYFLIQTFVSDEIVYEKYLQNQMALNNFLKVFTKTEDVKLEKDTVLGPFKIGKSNNDYLSDKIDLWIGKYDIKI